ncbi:MAG: hypothetical protein JXA28_02665 [Bacteroidetes bacterium]|nr:hypothetical protein [Bacteroidota bacterium]
MIDSLLHRFDIDPRQFRALLRMALRIDFRSGLFATSRKKKRRGRFPGLWQILLFYGFLGLVLSFAVIEAGDVFLAGTIMMTFVMLAVASSILVEFQSVVIAPEDYHILGHRPISSRTYFSFRLANMLVYVGLIAVSIAFVPVLFFVFWEGFRLLLGVMAILGILGSAVFTSMAIVFVYVNLLRWVHPKKLQRAFSYLQLLLSFIVYGSGMIFSSLFNAGVLSNMHVEHEQWMLALPPTWFSSLMSLTVGGRGWFELASILVGTSITAILIAYAYATMSLEYAGTIARLTESHEKHRGNGRPSRVVSLPMFTRNEARAAALLVRNQFKHDQKFRMSVLAIVPLTALYLIAGLSGGGGLADPFSNPAEHWEKANLLYLALAFFPVLLFASLGRSDSWQASWIFHVTPSDKGRIVLAVKDVLVIFFIIPYLLGLGIVFLFYFDSVQNVLLHVFTLSMLSHLILQVLVMVYPHLPFSRPLRKGERTANIFVGIMVAAIVMFILVNVLSRVIYPSAVATGVTLVVLAVLTLVFERLAAERVRRKTRLLQFGS